MTVPSPQELLTIEVRGESLSLLAQRAIWWPAAGTLIVADVHFGKSASFRHHGIAIPSGSTDDTLARLDQCLALCGAQRLVCLGDLTHARSGNTPQLDERLATWRAQYPRLRIDLVIGNHDRHAGVPASLAAHCHPQEVRDGPFLFAHHPQVDEDAYVLCGHVHPAVRLRAQGDELRLPAFAFDPHTGMLPAFGAFTGMKDLDRQANTRYFAIADNAVIALP